MTPGSNETGIRTIPPVLFLAAVLIAVVVQAAAPIPFELPAIIQWAGAAVFAAAVAMVVRLFMRFRALGSEYNARRKPTTLVTDGSFAWSRNPGYAAMVVGTLGLALVLENLWVVPATLVAAAIVDRHVIAREERFLEEAFGDDYRAYRAKVRRWL